MANSPSGGDCSGGVTDEGYNIADDASCNLSASTSVNASLAIDAYLGPLGANGGPTQTVPLLPTSSATPSPGPDPALGVIPSSFILPTGESACSVPDQRGVARYAPCDIGAFELPTDNYRYAAGGGTGAAPASGSGLDGTTITLASNTFTTRATPSPGGVTGRIPMPPVPRTRCRVMVRPSSSPLSGPRTPSTPSPSTPMVALRSLR